MGLLHQYKYSIVGGLLALLPHVVYLIVVDLRENFLSIFFLAGLVLFYRLGMVFPSWLALSIIFTSALVLSSGKKGAKARLIVQNIIAQPVILVLLMLLVSLLSHTLFLIIACGMRGYSGFLPCIDGYFNALGE